MVLYNFLKPKEYIFRISSYSSKHEVNLTSIWKFSLYLTENKIRLHYKDKSFFKIKPEAYLFKRDTDPLNKCTFAQNSVLRS